MRLRNQLIILIICIIAVIAVICLLVFGNQSRLDAPGSQSLSRLLVRTQAVVYHDEDALYGDHFAARIDDPETVNAIIQQLSQVKTKKKPLAADSEITTTASHRLFFSGSGVTLYFDENSKTVWYEYGKEVPVKQRAGYDNDVENPNTAVIYQIKSEQKFADFLELLSLAEGKAPQVEYVYNLMTADGSRGEYVLLTGDNSDLAGSTGGLQVNVGSRQQVRFVLRDRAYDGDEISIAALTPVQGGRRPMSSLISYDSEKVGRNDITIDLAWDENGAATLFAAFCIMVADDAFAEIEKALLTNFGEETALAYLPYLGITKAELDVRSNFALVNDGKAYYYLLSNGELRPITAMGKEDQYEVVSSDYFSLTSVPSGSNGYRGFLSKRAYSYNGNQFEELIISDYLDITNNTFTGYDITAELTAINLTERGLELTFAGTEQAHMFPYIDASFSSSWNNGTLRIKNTTLSDKAESYAYSGESNISEYYAEQEGEDVVIKISLSSWQLDFYHISSTATNGKVAVKLHTEAALDANL